MPKRPSILGQLINEQSKAVGGGNDAIAFKVELIDIDQLEPSELNKMYSVKDVADLKASIELIELQQNLVVRKRENTPKYEILSGHRRYRALQELVAEGKTHFANVPCKIVKSVDDIQAELQLIFANSTSRRLSDHELVQQAGRLSEVLRAYRDGGYKMTGKTRDIVAELLKVSASQVHRLESINKNLIPELKEELADENINITTSYELSRLDEEKQREALTDLQGGGELTPAKVQEKREKAADTKPPAEPPPKEVEKEPKLKPCPFCGGEKQVIAVFRNGKSDQHYISCKGGVYACGAGMDGFKSRESVIKAWNKRA